MKVLLAEDSVMMRRLLLRTLQTWGYDVTEAENGAIAWRQFQRQPFQLVLTDWVMPEMDGVELVRHIRAAGIASYVYIILLTAKSEKEDLLIGMEAGADDFLVKPVDPAELRVRMRAGERIIHLEQELAGQNRKLRETQAALVQSEKLAGLGQMAAGVAHEINNPIAVVANNLAVLKRDVSASFQVLDLYRTQHQVLQAESPETASQIAKVVDTCDYAWIREESPRLFENSVTCLKRVGDIVKNLRQFARLDEAQLDELDISQAASAATKILEHEAETAQVRIELEYEPVPRIICEPAKIQQVVHHLVLNAIQASEPGQIVRVGIRPSQEGVVIEVTDHGCGIANSDLAHVFEPFFTTRRVGSGRGLGLAVSYGIIRDHDGSIEVSSEMGVGSTFRVQLPIHPPSTQRSE